MISRERLLRLFAGERADRPAVKVWGLELNKPPRHPAYREIHELGIRHSDLVHSVSPTFNPYAGHLAKSHIRQYTRKTGMPDWEDVLTEYDTGRGKLCGVFRESTTGGHGYQMEYPVKEAQDLEMILAMPYEQNNFDASAFYKSEKLLGDRGITTIYFDHAGMALWNLMGSETLAYLLHECPDLLEHATSIFSNRILAFAKEAYKKDLCAHIGWVGPELFIPPLTSMDTFERLVFSFDKKLINLAHENSSSCWVHCHGKMRAVLPRMADMGVDVLNPIEPPPMGDLTIEEAFMLNKDRMTLEGNIETHDLMTLPTRELTEKIEHVLKTGHRMGRLILSPSSGYDEEPVPSKLLIENLRAFILKGVEIAKDLD